MLLYAHITCSKSKNSAVRELTLKIPILPLKMPQQKQAKERVFWSTGCKKPRSFLELPYHDRIQHGKPDPMHKITNVIVSLLMGTPSIEISKILDEERAKKNVQYSAAVLLNPFQKKKISQNRKRKCKKKKRPNGLDKHSLPYVLSKAQITDANRRKGSNP